MIKQPVWTIIAGPNGAGKTTAAYALLSQQNIFGVEPHFLNTDEIAKGLSPFAPKAAAITAGKIMLQRLAEMISHKQDFISETTLSSKTLAKWLMQAKTSGYQIELIYIWVPDINLSITRVRQRAATGGHDIPEIDIRRRYQRGLNHLFNLFMPLVNQTQIYVNNGGFRRIALLSENNPNVIDELPIWSEFNAAGTTARQS